MISQFKTELTPKIRYLSEAEDNSLVFASVEGVDILEVSEETVARIAKHSGESSQVYADTRVRQPARFRAQIVVRADVGNDQITSELGNLLDASSPKSTIYAVTSLFSTCYNMMVVSSRRRDTNDTRGLRIQDVVFEECILAGGKSDDPDLFQVIAEDETDTAYDGTPMQDVEEDRKESTLWERTKQFFSDMGGGVWDSFTGLFDVTG